MTEKSLFIRLAMKDDAVVKRALEEVGTTGDRALSKVSAAAVPASTRLRLVNTVATEGQAVMRNYAAQLGPVGNLFGMLGTRGLLAAGAIAAVGTAIVKGVGVTKDLETLKASLVTVTGSVTAAEAAFDRIKAFAVETPFSIEEVTDAFVKMTALGLKPSQEAMRAYGDMASGMGKSLNQLIEAVADAATGEFERLKDFGIKARSEGSRVEFTFADMSTTVRKESAAIQGYIQNLAKTNFADGMARQMDTLAGKFSNLRDAARTLSAEISRATGGREVTAGVVGYLTDAANAATATLKSWRDVSNQLSETRKEIAETEAVIARTGGSGIAGTTASTRLRNLRVREAKEVAEAERLTAEVAADAARQKEKDDARAAGAARERAAAIGAVTAEQTRELELARMVSDQRAQQVAADRAEADLRKAVIDASEEEVAAVRARAIEVVKANQATAESAKGAGTATRTAAAEAKKAAEDWLRVQRAVADELDKSNRAKAEASDDIDRQIQSIRDEAAMLGLSNTEREIAVQLLQAEETARRGGTRVTDEQAEAIRREAEALARKREATAEEKRTLDQAARDAQRTTDDVVDYASGGFEEYPAAALADPEIGTTLSEILAP